MVDGEVSASSTNAINSSQLYAVATGINTNVNNLGTNIAGSLGGSAAYNTTTGAWTAPTYTIGKTAYNDVGSALAALNAASGKTKYFNVNAVVTLPDSQATGSDSIAIGPNSKSPSGSFLSHRNHL